MQIDRVLLCITHTFSLWEQSGWGGWHVLLSVHHTIVIMGKEDGRYIGAHLYSCVVAQMYFATDLRHKPKTTFGLCFMKIYVNVGIYT